MIEVKDVCKSFGKDMKVKHVTVRFSEGNIYGIIGRNGSGKTLLLKMICGLMLPTQGSITVSGKEIGKDIDFPPETGAIIENPAFLDWKSGYHALLELASIQKKIGKEEVREAMEKVGLSPDEKKAVRKYSLGMRQRLAIAQAIMEQPKILVLDEPMNGLDKSGVKEMRKLFCELRDKGILILLTSHNQEDISVMCDVIYEMENGEMSSYQPAGGMG